MKEHLYQFIGTLRDKSNYEAAQVLEQIQIALSLLDNEDFFWLELLFDEYLERKKREQPISVQVTSENSLPVEFVASEARITKPKM